MTDLKTPGVYVTELSAFPSGIVGVATAIPVFIGYTEFAADARGEPLYGQAVEIGSAAEYAQVFGGAAPCTGSVTQTSSATPDFHATAYDTVSGSYRTYGYDLALAGNGTGAPGLFNLYWQMQLYFAQGGGACYVVSVGSYWAGQKPLGAAPYPVPADWGWGSITAADLHAGIDVAGDQVGPTLLVVPEACQLDAAGYAQVANAMLAQAGSLQDRLAVLDVPGCLGASTDEALTACQAALWTAIAPQAGNASWGASYGPAVTTSLIDQTSFLFNALTGNDNSTVNAILTANAASVASANETGTWLATMQSAIAAAFPVTNAPKANDQALSNDASGYPLPTGPSGDALKAWQLRLDNLLLAGLPVYEEIKAELVGKLAVQPASGAIAGAIVFNDANQGVWTAPANMSLDQVVTPICLLTDAEQAAFNVPVNGMAMNAIRYFTGRGPVIWGARTLDGNSNDYRYVQVRRTLIYIEQSIKAALRAQMFAGNNGGTWATVTAEVSSFLTALWQQGGLLGDKASDAFTVQCGLGSTMTELDVLNGQMVVAVTLQMIHPAEFIQLTFRQSMEGV
jgi:phage tail sheath protein FI